MLRSQHTCTQLNQSTRIMRTCIPVSASGMQHRSTRIYQHSNLRTSTRVTCVQIQAAAAMVTGLTMEDFAANLRDVPNPSLQRHYDTLEVRNTLTAST